MRSLLTILLTLSLFTSCDTLPSSVTIGHNSPELRQFIGARVRLKFDMWALPVDAPGSLGAPCLFYILNFGDRGVFHVTPGTLATVVEFRDVGDSTSGSMPHIIFEVSSPSGPLKIALMTDVGGLADEAGIDRLIANNRPPAQNLAAVLAPSDNVLWKRVH